MVKEKIPNSIYIESFESRFWKWRERMKIGKRQEKNIGRDKGDWCLRLQNEKVGGCCSTKFKI